MVTEAGLWKERYMNIPVEFKERMKKLLGAEYDEYIRSYEKNKAQGIRVNTLKINIEDFKKICSFELKAPIPWEERGFYIEEEKPGKHPYHAAGLYYVQEPSAMAVAAALGIKKGDRVLDLCAAPGGKSTQAAAYLHGEGVLVANEIEPKRARILSENIERCGIKNAIVTNNSPDELVKYFNGYFDKIIVDAPCSGEGMFKKEEAAIEEWSQENVIRCSIRQKNILEAAEKMLRPGGYLIYSTCTFSLEENEMVVEDFLDRHNSFNIVEIDKRHGFSNGFYELAGNTELKKSIRLFPHRLRGEGHFMCLLQKMDGDMGSEKPFKSIIKMEDLKDYFVFAKENLNVQIEENLYLAGENLYSLPNGIPDIKGLKILRSGIHLGSFKKNRFEPNHALALSLKYGEAKRNVNLESSSDEVISYLKGDTLKTDIEDGWTIVNVDGYSLGWGKTSRGILKNHYPKGLRW